MIIYSKTLGEFCNDIDLGIIGEEIQKKLSNKGFKNSNESEFRSWENSLLYMMNVLIVNDIPSDTHVAIEYNIPNTSKRVDFLISGYDEYDNPNVVIVELKQWESATRTSRKDIVRTYLAGTKRAVTHPSYQAYSYAKIIENYNTSIQDSDMSLIPSAYLHNYREDYRSEIDNNLYSHIIKEAPIFLRQDALKLRDFIKKYIKKNDDGTLLYQIDNGKIKPSKSLQDSIASMLDGNKELYMIDEQKVSFETVKKLVDNSLKDGQKYTIIIEGGPGTGKSVIAINLLAEFRNKVVNYVTKNTLFNVLASRIIIALVIISFSSMS